MRNTNNNNNNNNNTKYLVFLRSVRRLLVTPSVVPSSPILATLKKETLNSSETLVLTRAKLCNIPEDAILLVPLEISKFSCFLLPAIPTWRLHEVCREQIEQIQYLAARNVASAGRWDSSVGLETDYELIERAQYPDRLFDPISRLSVVYTRLYP
jgi:hypothetical protein